MARAPREHYELDYYGRTWIPEYALEDYETFRAYLKQDLLTGETPYNRYSEARAEALWQGAQEATVGLPELGIARQELPGGIAWTATWRRGTRVLSRDVVGSLLEASSIARLVRVRVVPGGNIGQWSLRSIATGQFVSWGRVTEALSFIFR